MNNQIIIILDISNLNVPQEGYFSSQGQIINGTCVKKQNKKIGGMKCNLW